MTLRRALAVVVVTLAAGGLVAEDAPGIRFKRVAGDETGILKIIGQWKTDELARHGGKWPRSHGWWPSGVTVLDYDRDGDLDLILAHHGHAKSIILRNNTRETAKFTFTNVTTDLGLKSHETMISDGKPTVWDFDGDGWLDVAGWSDEHKTPSYFNRQGKGFAKATFTMHPVSHPGPVVDLNGDGYPDVLYRVRRDFTVEGRLLYDPEKKIFKHTRVPHADWARLPEDLGKAITDRLGKQKKIGRKMYKINRYMRLFYTRADLNGDGREDLVVAGYGPYGGDKFGHYLLAGADGELVEATEQLGLPENGTPIRVEDVTGDGLPEVLVAHGKTWAGLYVNRGGKFERKAGPLTGFLVGRDPYLFKAWLADFDNDGDLDVVISSPRYGRERVFENLGGGEFKLVLASPGWDNEPVVICDINDDGKLDLIIGTKDKKKTTDVLICLNDTPKVGHFAKILPRMPAPNRYAVGAIVAVFKAGQLGKPGAKPFLIRKAHPDSRPVHVGLGAADRFDLRVTFPDGKITELRQAAAGTLTVQPPAGR